MQNQIEQEAGYWFILNDFSKEFQHDPVQVLLDLKKYFPETYGSISSFFKPPYDLPEYDL